MEKNYLMKKYKYFTCDNVIFSDEIIFFDFRKRRKEMDKKRKGKYKVNAWAAISRNGRSDIELFTNNIDSDFYWDVLKRNIKSIKNWRNKNYSTMRQCSILC